MNRQKSPSRTWSSILRISRCLAIVIAVSGFRIVVMAQGQTPSDPNLTDPTVIEALSYFGQKNYSEAARLFQQAILTNPNNAFAYYGLGVSFANLRQYADAIQPLRQALQLNPHPNWGAVTEKLVRALLREAETNAKLPQGDGNRSLDEVTIKVDEGTFVFKDLAIRHEQYLGYTLTGEVTNNTPKDWSNVTFSVKGLDANANRIENAFDVLNDITLFGFGKGETKPLGFTDGHRLEGFDKIPLTRVSIRFERGEYPAKYTFVMLKPSPSDTLVYRSALFEIVFSITKQQIGFQLENRTENPIKIDWNQVSYIDIARDTHKVMHEGVKYINRSESLAPSIIPPTANLKDIVFPIDYVSYSSSKYSPGWEEEPMFPEGPRAAAYEGQTFSVFMPMEINGAIKNYLFTFKIAAVEM